MSAKYYLDSDGVRVLVRAFNDGLSTKVDVETLNDYAKLSDLDDIDVDLTDYATKEYVENAVDGLEPYDDTEILNQIENLKEMSAGVYHFKGSVENLAELLEIENPKVGDTYNLKDTGMNAAWTGEEWDEFGSVADLTDYLQIEDVQSITIDELNAILYGGKKTTVSDLTGLIASIANDEAEVEITLNDDIILEDALIIPTGKSVVLNLGGNGINAGATSIVIDGEAELKNGTVTGTKRPLSVRSGGVLTVDDADVISTNDCAIDVSGADSEVIIESGNVIAQEVAVLATSGAKATINGGHLVGLDNFAVGGNGSNGQGNIEVTINGGIIEGKIQSNGYIAAGIYWPNSGTLNINGGTIISEGAGIVQRAGVINLNSGTVVTANGASSVVGKVGDSRVVVGPYAVVYDRSANYPAVDTIQLNIAADAILTGTDGDIQALPADAAGINDLRN